MLPDFRYGAASTTTPASPTSSPVQRRRLSCSAPPVSREITTPRIGTAAISSPASELGSFRSASDSRPHGPIISSAVNATSGRQCRRSASSWLDRSANGSRIRAPSAVRPNTTTGTPTPPTATLISR